MKKSIYQISNEFLVIQNQLIEQDGEFTDDQFNALAINEAELENKAVGYSFVIKDLDDDVEAINNEIKRLTQLKKARENAADRLKTTISNAMNLYGRDEIKTAIVKLSFRASESVFCDDVNALPAEYKTIKVTEAADKVKIKEALKNGEAVVGCSLVSNKSLQIK
jgi:hypothetical protein